MQKCLGIYIEDNLIKYAKVSKEKEDMKIESFGIRFFQDLSEEIEKIIQETYSFGTPVSINLANEKYLYFDIFALLNKKDIEKTVATEFESFCEEKNYNSNAFETRYALMPSQDDKEKIKRAFLFARKLPVSIALPTIANLNKRENQLIVNMEENTTITTIYDRQIYNVESLDIGSKEVLDNINKIENSYAKAYDICKNTTIYTAEVEETAEEQPYLQNIMPTIYRIAESVKDSIDKSSQKIQTIYLTGTLSAINNIDLYFQEFLPDIGCKILKPSIVDEAVTKINIKDYVEVNSAIALATVGLGEGIQELNFQKQSASQKLSGLLSIKLPSGKVIAPKGKINFDLKGALDTTEMWLIRGISSVLLILIIFTVFSKVLSHQMLAKEREIQDTTSAENAQIESVNTDDTTINSKTQKYSNLLADIKRVNERMNDIAANRNLIPNLLSQIMYNIPDKVQLVSIQNTTGKNISIVAQSYKYEQLGMFMGILKTKGILNNVVNTSGTKNGDVVTVTIEGELP